MIINRLSNCERLKKLHPAFAAAFDFLSQKDLGLLPTGTYEINGKNLYAMVQNEEGKGREKVPLETHRKYIDIQYTIQGNEVIGYKDVSACTILSEGWNIEKDLCFFNEKPVIFFPVPSGTFAIFYPEEDAHAPYAGMGNIKKVVIKIKII